MKARMCVPRPNCWMVRNMDVSEANNPSRLSVKTPRNSDRMQQKHTRPLSLYPLILYLNVSDQSVTVGEVKTMLLIITYFYVNHWRNLI